MEDDGTPQIFWDEVWSPICGHYFWDNQHGASKFCEKLGYDGGAYSGRGSGETYGYDSFRLGKCNDNDIWPDCTGGCNEYEVGGICADSWSGYCTSGEEVKITITCDGDSILTSTSCTGTK